MMVYVRFNTNDTIVFGTKVGGNFRDAFTNVKVTDANDYCYRLFYQYANSKFNFSCNRLNGILRCSSAMAGVKVLINKFDSIGNKTWGTLYGNGTNKAVAWVLLRTIQTNYIFGQISGLSFPVTIKQALITDNSTRKRC